MKYDPSLGNEYEQNRALMQIVHEKGRMLSATLTDDSMDASSEMLGKHIWAPDGARFWLQRWHWTKNIWADYRESEVVLTPAEIETVLRGETLKFIKLTSKASEFRVSADIGRFTKLFSSLDEAAKQAIFDYVAGSDEGISWALAMQHVLSDWNSRKR